MTNTDTPAATEHAGLVLFVTDRRRRTKTSHRQPPAHPQRSKSREARQSVPQSRGSHSRVHELGIDPVFWGQEENAG